VAAEIRPLLRAGWMQTRYFKTMADEGDALPDTCAHVQRLGSLGDLPLTVLTATGPTWWPDLPPDIDPAKFREMWLDLQTDLTTLSTNSRQVFADRSSHFINLTSRSLSSRPFSRWSKPFPQTPHEPELFAAICSSGSRLSSLIALAFPPVLQFLLASVI